MSPILPEGKPLIHVNLQITFFSFPILQLAFRRNVDTAMNGINIWFAPHPSPDHIAVRISRLVKLGFVALREFVAGVMVLQTP